MKFKKKMSMRSLIGKIGHDRIAAVNIHLMCSCLLTQKDTEK